MHYSINSVLSQTYHHYQLIIVDDGSTDVSKAFIDSLNEPGGSTRLRVNVKKLKLPAKPHILKLLRSL